MRPIDADHVTSMLHEYVKREQSYIDIGNNRSVATGHRNGLLEAIAQIAEEPTVESRRMRGRWIQTEPDEPCFYQCSICRSINDFAGNFCPDCGAEMGELND